MPTTRALSARHHATQRARQNSAVKSQRPSAISTTPYDEMRTICEVIVDAPLEPTGKPTSGRPSSRTCSMPVLNTTPIQTDTSTAFDMHSTPSKPSNNSRVMRASHSSACSSATSFCSSIRGVGGPGDGSDGSDEEGDRPPSSRRLGGCNRLSEARPTRDDSNKENVAPLRNLSDRSLRRELAAQQEDTVIRHTRTRVAAPMSDRSDSLPGSPHLLSRRPFRRTVSTPMTLKRSRVSVDSTGSETSLDNLDLRSPTSRPRLDLDSTTPDELESCYFSSQATSIFDAASTVGASPLSRCTTPEPTETETCDPYGQEQVLDHEEATTTSRTEYPNIFVHARALLRYGVTADVHIVGRNRERGALQRFLQKRFGLFAHLEHSAMPNGEALCPALDGASDSGSLYVCGLPGTGKTALIRSVLTDVEQPQGQTRKGDKRPCVAFIDCMSIRHPRELFKRLLEALHEDTSALPTGDAGDGEAERRMTAIVRDPTRKTLIVLDEIDHLLGSRVHQNILYRLFSWPRPDTQGCALIGIANSLDLTERFVPLLASKGAAPAVLNFRPFEAEEIKSVIGARLAQLNSRYDGQAATQQEEEYTGDDQPGPVPLFLPAAFELVARKVAAATGDLRKALDACRLAVEAIEAEVIRTSKPESPMDLRQFTPHSAPKIMPSHILKVISAVLGSPQLTKIRSLGLQPKLILLSLLIAQKRAGLGLCVLGGGSATGTGRMAGVCPSNGTGTLMCDVEATYAAMLKNDDFAVLESSELIDVMEGLEVEGVVRIATAGSSNGGSSTSSERSPTGRTFAAVSPSAKRAAKRQLLASYRRMQLATSVEEVLRGITTTAPAARTVSSSETQAVSHSTAIAVDAIKRIWQREEHNAERAKGWEAVSKESQRVRDEELGGGRGALGI